MTVVPSSVTTLNATTLTIATKPVTTQEWVTAKNYLTAVSSNVTNNMNDFTKPVVTQE